MSTLRAALALAARGVAVFPLGPNKRPLPGQGAGMAKGSATTDPEAIEAWHQRWPQAILFALTGAKEDGGLGVVIDLDRHEGKDGFLALPAAEERLGTLPPTLTCATPSNGEHRHFRWPGGEIRNTTSEIAPGIDSKGTRGTVIMPPSVALTGAYRWLDPAAPIADLPEGWITALRPKPIPVFHVEQPLKPVGTRYAYGALRAEIRRILSAQNGTRHTAINRAAFSIGQLVGGGLLTYAEAYAPLFEAALSIQFPESEAASTVRDGLRDGAQAPRKATR